MENLKNLEDFKSSLKEVNEASVDNNRYKVIFDTFGGSIEPAIYEEDETVQAGLNSMSKGSVLYNKSKDDSFNKKKEMEELLKGLKEIADKTDKLVEALMSKHGYKKD